MIRAAAFVLALVPALGAPALAQEPPGRVGRVAWTQGEVAVHLEEDRGWEKAFVNSPLTSENSIWTEPRARAEVRIGGTAIRLDDTTQFDIRRLDDDELVAHVARGTVAFRIRFFEPGERYTVSTPHGRFQLLANGRYRIDAEDDRGQSRLTVFSGSATLDTSGRRVNVSAGEAVRLYGEGSAFDFERAASGEFDTWTIARDERLMGTESARYVSPSMTGYEDLDANGNWVVEAELGPVWYPSRVDSDWAPYRDGHWTYTRTWGYTWIDDAPWGYAPFHYGRWVQVGNRWGWHPGRRVHRPVWAPALVGWIGRPGWSVTIGSGAAPVVGWYPLSPWDRYQPWYTNSSRYANNVNVIVVGNRPARFRDRDHDWNRRHGATVQTREGFGDRRPVRNSMARVSADAIAQLPIVRQPSQVLPSRQEMSRGNRPGNNDARRTPPAPAAAAPSTGAPASPFERAPRPGSRPDATPPQRGNPGSDGSRPESQGRNPRSAPEQPVNRAAPQPVTRSAPEQPAVRSAPEQPAAQAAPAPRVRESRPNYRDERGNEAPQRVQRGREAPQSAPALQAVPQPREVPQARQAPQQVPQARQAPPQAREVPQSRQAPAPQQPQQQQPAREAQPQAKPATRETREAREARERDDKNDDNRNDRGGRRER